MQTTISEHGIFVGVGGSAMASTSSLPNSNEIVCCYKRLSIDLSIPDTILARRGGISFGAASTSTSRPRLGRRGAISFDKGDKTATYVRQLGDVRIQSQQDKLHQYILNNLQPADRKILQSLASPSYKTRCGNKFLTLSGMRRRRRCLLKHATDGQSLVDDYYKSPTACLLDKSSEWAFDVFSLDHSSNGRPLFHMILKLFQEHNLVQHFNLDIVKLMKFSSLVEEGYHQNPYHNAIHAADVTQAMHCYILQEKIARHMSPLETLTSLLAAITHDLDHPGVNQAFLIATSNHLASLYKNNSVLENHHWRSAVGVLHQSGLLNHLPVSVRKTIFKQMKSLILATDMTRQQEFYSRLRGHISNHDLDMSLSEDRHFILQIALKCADISNPCRPWSTCKVWSRRVCDEFFQQGDYERKLDLPITNLCDRFKNSVTKIQTGFIDFVVEPLFTEFSKFLNCDMLKEQLNNMKANRMNWESIIKEETAAVAPRPSVIELDINSNVDVVCNCEEADSGTESDTLASPVSASSSAAGSEIDELPSDMTDIHSNIALVAERMEWIDKNERRPSLPVVASDLTAAVRQGSGARRESFPRIHDNRRTCLPHTSLYQAISFDQLVEKLTNLERNLSLNGSVLQNNSDAVKKSVNSVNLDNLLAESRLSTLTPSIETSQITNYLVNSQQLVYK